MVQGVSRSLLEVSYADYAQEYLRSLPLEHFMESTTQGTQRKITLAAFDQIHAVRPEVQHFNELLVQYHLPRQDRPGQVVPDNLVVICEEEIEADGSYDVLLQPVGPFMTLEYVSKGNKRKDYKDSFTKYEKQLRVPYYLVFRPDRQDLRLYRLRARKYVLVAPNDAGRHPIPDLEVEVALLDRWVRFWFRGRLLPLTAELVKELEQERRRADREKRRADGEQRRADGEQRRADAAVEQAEAERRARLDLEREVEELRAQLEKNRRK